MNDELKNYYEILGVTQEDSLETIDLAQQRKLAENSNNPMMKIEIRRAYSILSDANKRKEYDERLNQTKTDVQEEKVIEKVENTNRDFEFFVDPQQLLEEQTKFEGEYIIIEENDDIFFSHNHKVYKLSEEENVEEVQKEECVLEEKNQTKENDDEINRENIKQENLEEENDDIFFSHNHKVYKLSEEENVEEIQKEECVLEEKNQTKENDDEINEENIEQEKSGEDMEDIYISPNHTEYNLIEEEKNKEEHEEMEDVYSSSDHRIHSLFEETKNYDYIIPIKQKEKQTRGKIFKLFSNNYEKISEIKTQESKLIEDYNNKLDEQINDLLSQPHNNYNLQISKSKYEGQIYLLRKRIEIKVNEKVKSTELTKHKLECISLKKQLKRAEDRLKEINSKIIEYNEKEKNRNPILNITNEMLYEKTEELKEEKQRISIKKLNIQIEILKKVRDLSANGLKITRSFVGKIQDGAIKVFDNACSVKEIFLPDDEINYFNSK